MALLFPDKRKAITGEFFMQDSRLRHNSRRAYRKIRGWKSSARISEEAEEHYQEQFDNLISRSFFNLVASRYILIREKFQHRPLVN